MSLTRKTPQHLRSVRKSPGVVAAEAADAAAADAVGDAAGAVAAAEAAARPGDVAAGARSAHRPTTLTEPNTTAGSLSTRPAFVLVEPRAVAGPSETLRRDRRASQQELTQTLDD